MTTEPKKRGRPPGSGKKKEVVELPDGITEISRSLNDRGGFAIDTEKYNVPPFPSNWNEMGKLEKLKYLTEHRK